MIRISLFYPWEKRLISPTDSKIISEPAIHLLHNDGNPSLLLKYASHTVNQVLPGVEETVITLQDDKYPVTVLLHFVAYGKETFDKNLYRNQS